MSTIQLGRFCAGGVTLLVMIAGVALAQDEPATPHRGPHGGEHPLVQRADQNGDGIISYDEAIESLPGMTEDRFKHMDVNSDGQLEADEMRARSRRGQRGPGPEAMRQHFSEADTDGDGKLSLSEVREGLPRFPEDRFSTVDADGDGGLSIEELAQSRVRPEPTGDHRGRRTQMVERLDADGNGEVSLEELRAVRPDMSEERFSRADRDKSGGMSREEFGAAAGDRPSAAEREAFVSRVFTARDANGDGSLDFEEVKEGRRPMSQERFKRADADSDGALSKEEFAAMFGRRGPEGRSEGHRTPIEPNQN